MTEQSKALVATTSGLSREQAPAPGSSSRALPPRLANAITIADLRALAHARMPRAVFGYLDGGAEDETSLAWNRDSFRRWAFVPRILPSGSVDLSIDLFGERLKVPLIVGPTGLNGAFWYRADVLLARAAAAAGAAFCLSTVANSSIEQVAAESSEGTKWFQIYPLHDRNLLKRLVERAAAAGYKALVVTVDASRLGGRERDLRNDFSQEVRYSPKLILDGMLHPRWVMGVWRHGIPRFENMTEFVPANANARDLVAFVRSRRHSTFSWDDLAWLRGLWKGPFIVKGVLAVDDAEKCANAGADGIVVSNHGGRQLDGAIASLDALVPIVDAVGDRLTVIVDGGFRRGADVMKALALGAKAVLLGRAPLYGVSAAGEAGAARALAILSAEIDRGMYFLGCPSISALTRAHVRERVIVPPDDALLALQAPAPRHA